MVGRSSPYTNDRLPVRRKIQARMVLILSRISAGLVVGPLTTLSILILSLTSSSLSQPTPTSSQPSTTPPPPPPTSTSNPQLDAVIQIINTLQSLPVCVRTCMTTIPGVSFPPTRETVKAICADPFVTYPRVKACTQTNCNESDKRTVDSALNVIGAACLSAGTDGNFPFPTNVPLPSNLPTNFPTGWPTNVPFPTNWPTNIPFPTNWPTNIPFPTQFPSGFPTQFPSGFPTQFPSGFPTALPTNLPPIPTSLPQLPDLSGIPTPPAVLPNGPTPEELEAQKEQKRRESRVYEVVLDDGSRITGSVLAHKSLKSSNSTLAFLAIPYTPHPPPRFTPADPHTLPFNHTAPSSSSPSEDSYSADACPQLCKGPLCPPSTSEDCLKLSIFTPFQNSTTDGPPANLTSTYPVVIHIHAGDLTQGSSSWGARMSEKFKAVVVSFNFRLGLFGFSNLEGFEGREGLMGNYTRANGDDGRVGKRDPYVPLNLGVLDQRVAIEWVLKHVGKFGGDPKKVTLLGSSTGALTALLHATHPPFTPLIQSLILVSPPYLPLSTPLSTSNIFLRVSESLNCKTLTCLQQTSTRKLLKALDTLQQKDTQRVHRTLPLFINGLEVPEHPYTLLQKLPKGMKVLVGSVEDEMYYPLSQKFPNKKTSPRGSTFQLSVRGLHPELAAQTGSVEAVYKQTETQNFVDSHFENLVKLMGDFYVHCPLLESVSLRNVGMFYFRAGLTGGEGSGVGDLCEGRVCAGVVEGYLLGDPDEELEKRVEEQWRRVVGAVLAQEGGVEGSGGGVLSLLPGGEVRVEETHPRFESCTAALDRLPMDPVERFPTTITSTENEPPAVVLSFSTLLVVTLLGAAMLVIHFSIWIVGLWRVHKMRREFRRLRMDCTAGASYAYVRPQLFEKSEEKMGTGLKGGEKKFVGVLDEDSDSEVTTNSTTDEGTLRNNSSSSSASSTTSTPSRTSSISSLPVPVKQKASIPKSTTCAGISVHLSQITYTPNPSKPPILHQ
ncbi:hypothetical protein HDV05_005535, partial [Chytridiales sp. JEL 0842]